MENTEHKHTIFHLIQFNFVLITVSGPVWTRATSDNTIAATHQIEM